MKHDKILILKACEFEVLHVGQTIKTLKNSTSKHFYDVTAHRYVKENCQEMGMIARF